MSLNGLDNEALKEAHEAAIAENGGWFLLKYASRDEVEIYCHGTTGIVEMRNAIAKYEEPSPLYGFLKYRRRNVILKYQPEDCSRLIQARATVHYKAVCDRFTPYHTTFEISDAKELKDTKLSAACSLHAASGSCSSSTSSLRRRRLMEITEEEEEEERERKRQSVVQEEDRPVTSGDHETRSPLSSPEPPVVLDKDHIESPPQPNFASIPENPSFEGVRPTSPSKYDLQPVDERRISSQTARPDLYSYSSYTYGKPRVKLGPRPSIDASKRPHTAGTFRPVAALPAGFKLTSKGSRRGRSGSQDLPAETEEEQGREQEASDLTPLHTSSTASEAPKQSESDLLPLRPNTSSGASMKSISSMAPTKEAKITPEKARLIKAMKLRQQKKHLTLTITEPASTASTTDSTQGTATIQEISEEPDAEELPALNRREEAVSPAPTDSAFANDLPTPMTAYTEATEDTFTDSHPPSPTIASSEVGKSSKASSLSESTDETVQATKDLGDDHDTLSSELPAVINAETKVHEGKSSPFDEGHEEKGNIRESIEVDLAPIDTSDIRTQQISLPPQEDDDVVSPKSPYGIPVSKFASNDSKSPTTPSLKSKFSLQSLQPPSEPVPALPTIVTPPLNATTRPEQADTERSEAPSPVSRDLDEPQQDTPDKFKISVLPINTDIIRDTPESELADPLLDDDFMDELQSATFEEAQPMRVSKSPITPVFPSTSPKRPQTIGSFRTPPSRAFSNPMRGPLLAPADVSASSARSVSAGGAAFLHNITRQPSNASLSTKKPTSSSIAQRIKALEQLSGKSSNEDLRPRTATPSTSFISVRKQGVREPSKSPVPSLADRASPMTPNSPTPDQSREGSPELLSSLRPRERSGSVTSRLSMFEGGTQSSRGRPESIQVTARIVRDGNNAFPKRPSSKDPAEYSTTDLKQSPLFVDHLQAVPEPVAVQELEPAQLPTDSTSRETIQERRLSRDRKTSVSEDEVAQKRRSSLNIVKGFIKDRRTSVASKSADNLSVLSPPSSARSSSRPPSVHQTSSGTQGRRPSIPSRRSSSSKDLDDATAVMSPTSTDHSSDEIEKASTDDKKSKSRTSRFMRRLSSSLVATRKNSTPNTPTTVREEDEVTPDTTIANADASSQSAVAAYVGDVNVQFPDNLLWKRRSLCLDTLGFLILNTINGTEKSAIKRYHLSDFRSPYIPDVDMQELPNSICLDFVEGSALQLACEDRQGQKHTLRTLQEAHQKHTSFGH